MRYARQESYVQAISDVSFFYNFLALHNVIYQPRSSKTEISRYYSIFKFKNYETFTILCIDKKNSSNYNGT